MNDIRPEILEEVEDCIHRIKAFQEAQGRKIHASIKRARKGRSGMTELGQFGLPIPEDFRALYHNYNGAEGALKLTKWGWSVFFEFDWSCIEHLVKINKVRRLSKRNPLVGQLQAFGSAKARTLQLNPGDAQDGAVPLMMTLGPLSRNNYIAFDSTLAMLRSVCAAQDVGILHYGPLDATSRLDGQKLEASEIHYDARELWDVIRPYNPRADYWTALIEGTVDWDEIEVKLPADGKLRLDPEVRRLIVGDPQDYYDAAEEEMRKAGFSEEEIRRARTVEKD